MDVIDKIIIDGVLILFSFLVYLFYIAQANIFDKEKNFIALELSIFSSFYLLIKYGSGFIYTKPLIMVNIPLIFMYIQKRKTGSIILSLILCFYYYTFCGWNIYLLIFEYGCYYIIYDLINVESNKKMYYFIFVFSLLKTIAFKINLLINTYLNTNFLNNDYNIILFFVILFSSSLIAILLFKKVSDIIRIYSSYRELEKEKQIRFSLFKITHEIKNPIAVCKGYLDMFDVNNKDHASRYVPIIKEEIERILLLLQDFLCFSKLKIEKDLLDINLLVEESLETFDLLFRERHIKLIKEIDDDELFINADYNRLNQVIINVIKNSVEAIEEKGVIKVKVEQIPKYIKITIEDNGKGMDSEVKKNFKEPFFTTKKSGSGLGVSLSYEIVEAHGGNIKYVSNENRGTKVIITLPKKKD